MPQGVEFRQPNTGRKKAAGIRKMILVVVLVLGVAGTAVLLARESFTPETIRQPEQMQAEAEPQKEPEVENAAGEALSPAPEEAEQLLSATQEQSTSLPNLMGAWTQEEPPPCQDGCLCSARRYDQLLFYAQPWRTDGDSMCVGAGTGAERWERYIFLLGFSWECGGWNSRIRA